MSKKCGKKPNKMSAETLTTLSQKLRTDGQETSAYYLDVVGELKVQLAKHKAKHLQKV